MNETGLVGVPDPPACDAADCETAAVDLHYEQVASFDGGSKRILALRLCPHHQEQVDSGVPLRLEGGS